MAQRKFCETDQIRAHGIGVSLSGVDRDAIAAKERAKWAAVDTDALTYGRVDEATSEKFWELQAKDLAKQLEKSRRDYRDSQLSVRGFAYAHDQARARVDVSQRRSDRLMIYSGVVTMAVVGLVLYVTSLQGLW